MGRRSGSKNADYLKSKEKLVERLSASATAEASFRVLAERAKVSPATLRHYFQDREGVFDAVFSHHRKKGQPYMQAAAQADVGQVRDALRWLLKGVVSGWQRGLGAVHGLGLGAGLGDARVGPSYVNEILEPTLQSVEARLQRHIDLGELKKTHVRYAALALLSPVVLGLIHQQGLFGAKCRPLDLGAFIDDHVEHFVGAYAVRAPSR
ncbi:MAG: TetR/AcrR family transcriptional regulator [Myxococcaceae bacterium]|nr:TetR/AcrR family transcriptional regulator [Myxococcaceae bacterium]